jgi:hypothetical protein
MMIESAYATRNLWQKCEEGSFIFESMQASNDQASLDPVSEVHSQTALHPRKSRIPEPSSETSSPRLIFSSNAGKDGLKSSARVSDKEFEMRRMSLPGAETTTSSGFAPPHPTGILFTIFS